MTKEPDGSLPTFEDLSDLVKDREASQRLLLDVWKLANREAGQRLSSRPEAVRVFQLLVGTAFALWRAVFLRRKSREKTQERAIDFLTRVIQDNAIAYAHEKQLGAWTAGFYLNDAYFRVTEALEILRGQDVPEMPAWDGFRPDADRQDYFLSTPDREAWRRLHSAADAARQALSRLIEGQAAPSSTSRRANRSQPRRRAQT